MKLAVYGTLKKGKRNHHVLGTNAKKVGVAFMQKYNMYDLGGYPGIKFVGGDAEGINVEIYEGYDLERVDALEGEGWLYKREVVHLRGEDTYIYVFIPPVDHYRLVADGNWI